MKKTAKTSNYINKKIDSMKIFLGIEYTAFLIFAILMTMIFLSLWLPAMIHTVVELFKLVKSFI